MHNNRRNLGGDSLPLLLTGTIDSTVYNNTGNVITDVSERLSQYESAIYRYLTESPFNRIVFIENSGFVFDSVKFGNIAKSLGKEFEFIQGTICREKIIRYGKSYGDAFLIHEALQKSTILGNENFFYKMTGRIFLLNSDLMVKYARKYRNEFIIYPGIHWCLTYFFKANKEDYIEVLDDVFNDCDETTTHDIEISFYYRLKEAHKNKRIQVCRTPAFPYIEGKMGATGQDYSGRVIHQLVLNILVRFGVFTFDSLFSKVFWKIHQFLTKRKSY